jgi:ABC-2 type transport system ATP-binding protein
VKTPIRVVNLKKSYGKVKAVKEVSFGLDNGECFALLGVSGAGKTSVFQCLSGNLVPDHGEVTISGHDVTAPSGFEKARKLIGYCP